jgi:hypothetical protein
VFRAHQFLYGTEEMEGFEEPLGVQVLTQLLREAGVELPENARFDINVDKYGGVTISGLNNEELTKAIEKAMSFDSRLIISVLAIFVESAITLEGNPSKSTNMVLSAEQQRLIRTQSDLMSFDVGLHDLSFDTNGKIYGLPQELFDKIYGDRNSLFDGMNSYQIKQENFRLDQLRDDIIHFLRSGTAHVTTPDISLTFDNGRMIVNSNSGFNQNNGIGFNVTV